MPEEKERKSAKPTGYFSRRHQDPSPHHAAQAWWKAKKSPEARQARAEARTGVRAKHSPAEQLVELDRRLGPGIGAKRERARLAGLLQQKEE